MQNLGEPPADEAATQTDNLARSRLKGKEKVGEPSEPVALSHGTPSSRTVVNEPNNTPRDAEAAREPLGVVAPKIPVPPESVIVPSSMGGGAELRHPDPVREPLGAVAPEVPVPPESIPVPSPAGGDAELRHHDLDSEDPAADLNTRGR
ncbi:hypothetical protein LWI29_021303 [Acer saccharum]|uniref:Uncharacterized protein n=1 Tax=Acer saccharum TaxID=4024 RepID=A0AA39VBZ0_ACESA|nr:hypothetical protein LWI29_021303 [Acer saccharum]